MTTRSTLRETRNPLLALPAARALLALPEDQRAALAALLGELALDARGRANKCWATHKAPMAAYWKACSVYAGHLRKVVQPCTSRTAARAARKAKKVLAQQEHSA